MAHGASTRGWFLRDVLGTSPDFSERMSQVASTADHMVRVWDASTGEISYLPIKAILSNWKRWRGHLLGIVSLLEGMITQCESGMLARGEISYLPIKAIIKACGV